MPIAMPSAAAAKLGAQQKTLCGYCEKTVFKMEEFKVDHAVLHRQCFKCTHCKRKLTISSFASVNGKFYCKTHYLELFAKSGGTYGVFGDAGFKKSSSDSFKLNNKPDVAAASFKVLTSTVSVVEELKPVASSLKEKKVIADVPTGSSKLFDRLKQYEKVAGGSSSSSSSTSFKENKGKDENVVASLDLQPQKEQVEVADKETEKSSETEIAVKENKDSNGAISIDEAPETNHVQVVKEQKENVQETEIEVKEKNESDGNGVASVDAVTKTVGTQEAKAESITLQESVSEQREKVKEDETIYAIPVKVASKPSAPATAKLGAKQKILCGYCQKTVFKMEEFKVDNSVLHRQCFKCTHCKRKLTISSFASVNGKFYCKTHYLELFAKSGGTYGVFGDSGFKKSSSDSYKLQSKPDLVEESKPAASLIKEKRVTDDVSTGSSKLFDRLKQYEKVAGGSSSA
uniref:LIM zinc-binding domain-containing protein n=1 Tax=Aplanochytrium stocchinoi TaxID=215587 RepID=A0A7S3LN58_9STRA